MQFNRYEQPRFITLGDRLVDIYGIVDILPFLVAAPNEGTTPTVFHKVNLISGEWLKVFDDEGKEAIEAILARQGKDVRVLREKAHRACENRCYSVR